MLIFDRTNIHCSSSVIDGKKIGLTTFTKNKIKWLFTIVFNILMRITF